LCLLLSGCDAAGTGAQDGARDGAIVGEQEGAEQGRSAGAARGAAAGQSRAEADAAAGSFWEVYLRPGAGALGAAFLLGIALQYCTLYRLRDGPLPEWWVGLTVPRLGDSRVYQRWSEIKSLELVAAQRIRALEYDLEVRERALEGLSALATKYVQASSHLEELNRRKILEFFEEEAQRILDAARRAFKK
jgi:hypothetical protein